ncbi:YsnF/AvaK domain-containing protein [Pontibacter sp. SGAir0037]|uniref:YsnF/AvaK domain-containing protein n=1 Tax=Pontibacter sp. SGAir0037 TaxID=2571030 RepID=UPI0010CCB780|nr:YsnF/AvaK domain-containing protein [Pontibacter sp. SGAir0037]QCR22044.1 hypothetical protein C1N53_06625 [Pontibacter sp. SGAir0037]
MSRDKNNKELSEFEQKLQESIHNPQKNNIASESFASEPEAFHDNSVRTIPVIEEQLNVDKKVVETGRVFINKNVLHEEVTVDIPTVNEEVEVERIAVNEFVDSAPAVRYEGDKMIIPVLREVSVVVKKLMVVEELHVTKRKIETPASQQVSLRKEELVVTRTSEPKQNP